MWIAALSDSESVLSQLFSIALKKIKLAVTH